MWEMGTAEHYTKEPSKENQTNENEQKRHEEASTPAKTTTPENPRMEAPSPRRKKACRVKKRSEERYAEFGKDTRKSSESRIQSAEVFCFLIGQF